MNSSFDLLGRKTYEMWAATGRTTGIVGRAPARLTKYVASNTITSGEWQPSVFLGECAEKITEIKQQPGPALHRLGQQLRSDALIMHDLVDVLADGLSDHVGQRKTVVCRWHDTDAFQGDEGTVTPSGVMVVSYERAGAIATGNL